MAKVPTRFFWWFILSISTPTMDRGRFQDTSFYSRIKCVFLLQSVRVFSKNADVHNFISKWRRPWPFLWGDISFECQCPQWTGVDFPATSFYSRNKMCISFFSLWEFSQKMLTCTILSQNGEGPDPFFGVIYPFNFNAHNGPGRFSRHFLLSVDKMCFPSSVCESFLKKCWRAQFYLKMAKALTLSLGWFILSISMPTMDRGRFSSHFLLSVDNMCVSFFSLWEFSEKNANVLNFTTKWWRTDPIFLVIYPFNFNAHNGPG